MAVTYLEPIPELTGEKAIEFEEKMKNAKPIELTEKEIGWLKTIKINGKPINEIITE